VMTPESRRRPHQRGARDPTFFEQRKDFAIKEVVTGSGVLVQMNGYFFRRASRQHPVPFGTRMSSAARTFRVYHRKAAISPYESLMSS
jgi:hypothetical protein